MIDFRPIAVSCDHRDELRRLSVAKASSMTVGGQLDLSR